MKSNTTGRWTWMKRLVGGAILPAAALVGILATAQPAQAGHDHVSFFFSYPGYAVVPPPPRYYYPYPYAYAPYAPYAAYPVYPAYPSFGIGYSSGGYYPRGGYYHGGYDHDSDSHHRHHYGCHH